MFALEKIRSGHNNTDIDFFYPIQKGTALEF